MDGAGAQDLSMYLTLSQDFYAYNNDVNVSDMPTFYQRSCVRFEWTKLKKLFLSG